MHTKYPKYENWTINNKRLYTHMKSTSTIQPYGKDWNSKERKVDPNMQKI
jgi:hypothetical protein